MFVAAAALRFAISFLARPCIDSVPVLIACLPLPQLLATAAQVPSVHSQNPETPPSIEYQHHERDAGTVREGLRSGLGRAQASQTASRETL